MYIIYVLKPELLPAIQVPVLNYKDRQSLYSLARYFDDYASKYWVAGGSLLGVVRHQDIIPWDDDLDVAVPEADAQRLKRDPALLDEGTYKIVEKREFYAIADARALTSSLTCSRLHHRAVRTARSGCCPTYARGLRGPWRSTISE